MSSILRSVVECDVDAVLDNKRTNVNPFGVITKLTVKGQEIKSEWNETMPNDGKTKGIVAVLNLFEWDFGKDNPMTFIGVCSNEVAARISANVETTSKIDVQLDFEVWDHDQEYFIARKGTVAAQVVLSGGGSEVSIAPTARGQGRKRLAMRIEPASSQCDITVSDFPTQNFTKQFGTQSK